jgi:hypothetical protein
MDIVLDVRDITTQTEWFQRFQFEIPVLFYVPTSRSSVQDGNLEASGSAQAQGARQPILVERASPRAPVRQIEKLIQRAIAKAE